MSQVGRFWDRVGGEIEVFGREEGVVDVIEGMERDAVLGEDGEVSIGGIV